MCTIYGQLLPCHYYDKSLPKSLFVSQIAYFNSMEKLYIFGGRTESDSPSNAIYKWNTNNPGSWFEKIQEPTPTTYFLSAANNVVIINNTQAWFIGVFDGSDSSGEIYVFDAHKEQFISHTDPILTKPMHPVVAACLTTNNTHIFMVSGYNGSNIYNMNFVQIYDIQHNTWHFDRIEVWPLSQGFANQYCYMTNNILFTFGGSINRMGDSNQIWSYNALTSEWKNIGNVSNASADGSGAYFEQYVYFIGGYSNMIDAIWMMDIEKEIIINEYPVRSVVAQQSSVVVKNHLFIFGGYSRTTQEGVASVQVCDISVKIPNAENDTMFLIIGFCAALAITGICCWMRKKCKTDNEQLMPINYAAEEQMLGK
eukprot:255265_1